MKQHIVSLVWATVLMAVAAGGYAVAANRDLPTLNDMGKIYNDNATRPCVMKPGGWVTIDSDNSGGNLSAQIGDWGAFMLQCDADAYFAQGTSAAAADSGDGWIAAGAILKLGTNDGVRYVSVLNKTDATADCHYVECL